MPRILRIINRFNLGGITYNVSYLTRYLPPDYETLLIGGPEEEQEESSLFIPRQLGLNPLIIKEMRRSVNPFKDYFAYRRICRLIKEYRPDIVHTHASKAGALGRLAAIKCGVPVVVHTFHGHVFSGYFGPLKTAFYKSVERWLAKRTTAVVAISNRQKRELSQVHRICEPGKIHVIRLGFDLERFVTNSEASRAAFRERYGLRNGEVAIGIVGRLAPIKNHFLFIDAVCHVMRQVNTPLKAFIIGGGEMEAALKAYLASNYGDEAK